MFASRAELQPYAPIRDASLWQKMAAAGLALSLSMQSAPALIGALPEPAFAPPVPEEMQDTVSQMSDRAIVGTVATGGVGYWLYSKGAFTPENYSFDQPEEGINVFVEQTNVYSNDIYIPLTVVSKVGVAVDENEAGLFDFLPFVDGGPVWGTQHVILEGVGDVDIAIDGKINAYRDEYNPTIVHVDISTFRTWRPRLRMESLVFNPDGGEMSGAIGVPSTRDRATQAALVALQALVANEGCRAVGEAMIMETVVQPIVQELMTTDIMKSQIGQFDPSTDTVRLHMRTPDEDDGQVSTEEFRTHYTTDESYDPATDTLRLPQLGENEALALLAEISNEVDHFSVVDGAGNVLTIDDLLERQEICQENALGSVVKIFVRSNGSVFIGDRDELIENGNAPEGISRNASD